MTDLKFQPVRHDHKAFLEKASERPGFTEAYKSLEVEYALAHEMLAARARAGLTQEAVASRMGTTKSAPFPAWSPQESMPLPWRR